MICLGAVALSLCVIAPVSTATAGVQAGRITRTWVLSAGTAYQSVSGTLRAESTIPGAVVQVVAGNADTYALTSTGTVWAWGKCTGLGDGSAPCTSNSLAGAPVQVDLPVPIAWLAPSVPYDAGMAVDASGNVWVWGDPSNAELCLPGKATLDTPVDLSATYPALSDISLTVGAGQHTLYYASGALFACGSNAGGALGVGKGSHPTPVQVTDLPAEPIIALTASYQASGALFADGTYDDWGLNTSGQLGDGTTTDSFVPVKVSLPAPVSQVYQGGSVSDNGQTVALLSDGTLWDWGSNTRGQLGDGTTTASSVPVQVQLPAGVTVSQVMSGGRERPVPRHLGQSLGLRSERPGTGRAGDEAIQGRQGPPHSGEQRGATRFGVLDSRQPGWSASLDLESPPRMAP